MTHSLFTSHPNSAETLYDRILDTAEALIRRHGPAKVTVVDVARALEMSHGNVYRHFASKAALREAVVGRWLRPIELEVAAAGVQGSAAQRLTAWMSALAAAKRTRLQEDPELFAAYAALGDEQQGAVARYFLVLTAQLVVILTDGVQAGEFKALDPAVTARALLDATSAFHNPHRVVELAADPNGPARLATVIDLLVTGLKGSTTGRGKKD